MPYIKKGDGRREALRNGYTALTPGELNYQIFYYFKHNYMSANYHRHNIKKFVNSFLGIKPNYQKYNDMTGALLRCYKEIQRRFEVEIKVIIEILDSYDKIIGIYEDYKIEENGDVE